MSGESRSSFAHLTNQMGNVEGDFEKGEGDGSHDTLEIVLLTAQAWLKHPAGR